MTWSVSFRLPLFRRRECRLALAFFWTAGLLCGLLVFRCADPSFFSVMRSLPARTVSIVEIAGVTLLPFLFTAFVVYISRPCWIFPICFAKAFVFAFVSLGILQAFGSAGWLVRCLLMFSNCVGVVVLFFWWLRCFSGSSRLFSWETGLAWVLVLLTAAVDHHVISPFLASLLVY